MNVLKVSLLKCFKQVIVHNVNALTKYAGLDQCGDESTWATASPGER